MLIMVVGVESNSMCNHMSTSQNLTTVKQESNLSISSMIMDIFE